jgi:pyocin large subunit-like protein
LSIEALNRAFKADIKKSSLKFILVALSDYANEEGEAYPSIQTLNSKTSLNRKTIISGLMQLESLGFIKNTGKKVGRTNSISVWQITQPGEQSQKGDSLVSSPNSGTPSSPKNGTAKQSQKRDTEPSVILTTSVTTRTTVSFDDFYKIYPKKIKKKDSLAIWKKLSVEQRQAAKDGVESFTANKDIQFIAAPDVYLRGERWNDERIIEGGSEKPRASQRLSPSAQHSIDVLERIKRLG